MGQQTYYEQIIDLIKSANRPIQRKEISQGLFIESNTLGVILNRGIGKGLWVKYKIIGFPSFYCHPSWVKDGKLIQEFDPIFKEYTNGNKN